MLQAFANALQRSRRMILLDVAMLSAWQLFWVFSFESQALKGDQLAHNENSTSPGTRSTPLVD